VKVTGWFNAGVPFTVRLKHIGAGGGLLAGGLLAGGVLAGGVLAGGEQVRDVGFEVRRQFFSPVAVLVTTQEWPVPRGAHSESSVHVMLQTGVVWQFGPPMVTEQIPPPPTTSNCWVPHLLSKQ
jgi:hypothetical protein